MENNIYIAPNATITGNVTLENNVNIWYGAVLRGDNGQIHVGAGSNVQDNCVLHETVCVGAGCTIGHGAILHGCSVGDHCLIGMSAIILDGAILAEHCIVGAGAVVTGKTNAPAGSLLLGNPAQIVKSLNNDQIEHIHRNAQEYIALAKKTFG